MDLNPYFLFRSALVTLALTALVGSCVVLDAEDGRNLKREEAQFTNRVLRAVYDVPASEHIDPSVLPTRDLSPEQVALLTEAALFNTAVAAKIAAGDVKTLRLKIWTAKKSGLKINRAFPVARGVMERLMTVDDAWLRRLERLAEERQLTRVMLREGKPAYVAVLPAVRSWDLSPWLVFWACAGLAYLAYLLGPIGPAFGPEYVRDIPRLLPWTNPLFLLTLMLCGPACWGAAALYWIARGLGEPHPAASSAFARVSHRTWLRLKGIRLPDGEAKKGWILLRPEDVSGKVEALEKAGIPAIGIATGSKRDVVLGYAVPAVSYVRARIALGLPLERIDDFDPDLIDC